MGDWRRWRFHHIHTLYHTTVVLTDGAFFSLELIYCFGTDIPIFNEMETSILKTFHQYYPLGLLVAVVGAGLWETGGGGGSTKSILSTILR